MAEGPQGRYTVEAAYFRSNKEKINPISAFSASHVSLKPTMANIRKSVRILDEQASLRYLADIDKLSDEQLLEHNYYKGFPCVHGHVIRDATYHWCYHCARKISSNRCGFDINYLHVDYKTKYFRLWGKVKIGNSDECWTIQTKGDQAPTRIHMPSYRSEYSAQKCEHVSFHKALYQCAWGDVGKLVVTRTCGNPWCGNPLHMTSSWNRSYPPQKVNPMVTEFEAEKLMLYGRLKNNEIISNIGFRMAITNPLESKETEE